MKHRLIKRLSLVLALVTLTTVMTSCGWFPDEIFSGGNQYICVINTRTGKEVKQIAPAEEKGYSLGDDEVAYYVPIDNRFYNIDPNRGIADDGAPAFLTGSAKGYKEIQAIIHFRFRFNQSKICGENGWVLRHGKRNDLDDNGDLQFNARLEPDDPNEPNRRALTEWARNLNENLAPGAQKVAKPLWQTFSWPNLEFDYPIGADENGVLVNATANDGGDTPSSTYGQLEISIGKALSKELKAKLGDDYFCGVGYNANKPEVCPPIDVDLIDVSLVDQAPVEARLALDRSRDERDNAAQEAIIVADTLAQRKAAEASNNELKDLEIRESNKDAEVAVAKAAADAEAKKADVIASDAELQKCLVLIDKVGTCPLIEQAKQRTGDTSVTVNPGG